MALVGYGAEVTSRSRAGGVDQNANQAVIVIKADDIARALNGAAGTAEQVRLIDLQCAGTTRASLVDAGDIELITDLTHPDPFTFSARYSDSRGHTFEETLVIDISGSTLEQVGETKLDALRSGSTAEKQSAEDLSENTAPLSVSCQLPRPMEPGPIGEWTDGILELPASIPTFCDFTSELIGGQPAILCVSSLNSLEISLATVDLFPAYDS